MGTCISSYQINLSPSHFENSEKPEKDSLTEITKDTITYHKNLLEKNYTINIIRIQALDCNPSLFILYRYHRSELTLSASCYRLGNENRLLAHSYYDNQS